MSLPAPPDSVGKSEMPTGGLKMWWTLLWNWQSFWAFASNVKSQDRLWSSSGSTSFQICHQDYPGPSFYHSRHELQAEWKSTTVEPTYWWTWNPKMPKVSEMHFWNKLPSSLWEAQKLTKTTFNKSPVHFTNLQALCISQRVARLETSDKYMMSLPFPQSMLIIIYI